MPTKRTYSLFRNERCVRMTRVNLNEGKKYDATQVSQEGISQEELKAAEEKARKLIDIYNTDQKGGLSSLELALAMDGFTKAAGENGKLSRKEMKNYANELNQKYGLAGDDAIEVKDLKSFLKFVKEATKGDTKVSTQEVINKDIAARTQAEALEKARKEAQARLEAENKPRPEEEPRPLQESKERVAADADKQRLATPSNYTVQPGERLNDLLARSLKAQGKEVNDETLAEAKAEFIKNNPNALHGQKGKEYLYMGDVVKIAGGLEDKANAEEVKAQYRASIQAAKPEVKKGVKPDKPEAPTEHDKRMQKERERALKEGYTATDDENVFIKNGKRYIIEGLSCRLMPAEKLGVQKDKNGKNVNNTVVYNGTIKLNGADPNTGKVGNKDFSQVSGYGLCKYNPDLKGYEQYTGVYNGKYYENGKIQTLAKKKLVKYDEETSKSGRKYPDDYYRNYNTYHYKNGSLTPLYKDPTYDSNVQIKIGNRTFEMAKGKGGIFGEDSYAHWDYKDFLERFVDKDTGAIRAKNYTSNVYYLKSGDTWYPVKMDLQTKALIVDVNGNKYDMNDLMTGKVKI